MGNRKVQPRMSLVSKAFLDDACWRKVQHSLKLVGHIDVAGGAILA